MADMEIVISDLEDIKGILDNNGYCKWGKRISDAIELLNDQQERIKALETMRKIELTGHT